MQGGTIKRELPAGLAPIARDSLEPTNPEQEMAVMIRQWGERAKFRWISLEEMQQEKQRVLKSRRS